MGDYHEEGTMLDALVKLAAQESVLAFSSEAKKELSRFRLIEAGLRELHGKLATPKGDLCITCATLFPCSTVELLDS